MRISLAFLLAGTAAAQFDPSRHAWYTSPAGGFAETLPIGNGRVGAAIYGGPSERIVMNENSVWSGGWTNRANSRSKGALAGIRQKLMNGDLSGAGADTLSNMQGTPSSPRQYHPTVDLLLDLGHSSNSWQGYQRSLDTLMGTAFVTYNFQGVNYTREYVPSYPHGVIAVRLTAAQTGKLNVKVSLSRTQNVRQNSATTSGKNAVTLRADSGSNGGQISFTSEARVINNGGTVASSGNSLQVTGANSVDIFFNAETSYRYSSQSAWEAELKKKLDAAVSAGYDAVKKAATADYSKLMSRVSLDLGSSGSVGTQATPQRLPAYKNNANADPQLVTLYFQYGRHLLVAASRDTGALSLPANLQGIWNDNYSPPWQSKYTININTEMNYWPTLATNLAETHKPLFDLIDVAVPRGQAVASTMYGCTNGGFVLHHNTDLWGDAAPVDVGTTYMMWPMGGAWLVHHLMEQYRYTLDRSFLQQRVWPVLKKAVDFYYCYLFTYQNNYVTGPSISPENPFKVPNGMTKAGNTEGIDIAPAMDNQLLYALFSSVIEAAGVLGITGTDLDQAQSYLAKLKPPQVGSQGQILEWRGEYTNAEPGHRHMSPLWGLYPGSQMTPLKNKAWADASKKVVDERMARGSGSTGWSRAWVMALYARLLQGDTVWSNAQAFLKKYPTVNLWNTDGGPGTAFQADGNYGFTGAIAEMLLQSHAGVHLLPALPGQVASGSVTGLYARGNFVVDMEWRNKTLTRATVTSGSGGKLELRVQNGVSFKVNGAAYSGAVQTTAGGVYTITV